MIRRAPRAVGAHTHATSSARVCAARAPARSVTIALATAPTRTIRLPRPDRMAKKEAEGGEMTRNAEERSPTASMRTSHTLPPVRRSKHTHRRASKELRTHTQTGSNRHPTAPGVRPYKITHTPHSYTHPPRCPKAGRNTAGHLPTHTHPPQNTHPWTHTTPCC